MKEWPKKIIWDLEPYFENPDGSRDQQTVEDGFPLIPADLGRELYEALKWYVENDERGSGTDPALTRYEREVEA